MLIDGHGKVHRSRRSLEGVLDKRAGTTMTIAPAAVCCQPTTATSSPNRLS